MDTDPSRCCGTKFPLPTVGEGQGEGDGDLAVASFVNHEGHEDRDAAAERISANYLSVFAPSRETSHDKLI